MCEKTFLSLPVLIAHAGWRHDDDAAASVHPGGDGPSADGEESVQRETDGAAGGRPVDRDDQVDKRISECVLFLFLFFFSLTHTSPPSQGVPGEPSNPREKEVHHLAVVRFYSYC